MEQTKKDSIKSFFNLVESLKSDGVIRSSTYLGDIGEYICGSLYNLSLNKSQREAGHDAVDAYGNIYQVKINNSSIGKNQDIGDINTYSNLLLVVTRNSFLFVNDTENAFFLIYNIPSARLTGKYIARKILKRFEPEFILDQNLNILTV